MPFDHSQYLLSKKEHNQIVEAKTVDKITNNIGSFSTLISQQLNVHFVYFVLFQRPLLMLRMSKLVGFPGGETKLPIFVTMPYDHHHAITPIELWGRKMMSRMS